jgi:hypothetical protein
MSSELLGSAQNVLKGNLGGAWDINKGYADAYTDLGIARRFGGASAAYSLRDIGAMNGPVVNVRREPHDDDDPGVADETDFSANQVQSGVLEDWVNGKLESTLPADVATAAAAYSLRKVNSTYGIPVTEVNGTDGFPTTITGSSQSITGTSFTVREFSNNSPDSSEATAANGVYRVSATKTSAASFAKSIRIRGLEDGKQYTVKGEFRMVEDTTSGGDSAAAVDISDDTAGTDEDAVSTTSTTFVPFLIDAGYNSGSLGNFVDFTVTTVGSETGTITAEFRNVQIIENENSAVRIRRSSDDVEVIVGFDSDDKVSASSAITNVSEEGGESGSTTATDLNGFLNEVLDNKFSPVTYPDNIAAIYRQWTTLTATTTSLVATTGTVDTNAARYCYALPSAITPSDASGLKLRLSGTVSYTASSGGGLIVKLSQDANGGNSYDFVNPTLTGVGTIISDTLKFVNGNSGDFVLEFNGSASHNLRSIDFLQTEVTSGTTSVSFTNLKFEIIEHGATVHTWYDQAGSNNAVQATAANQPKIAENGALITDGLKFDGTNDMLTNSNVGAMQASDGMSSFTVHKKRVASTSTTFGDDNPQYLYHLCDTSLSDTVLAHRIVGGQLSALRANAAGDGYLTTTTTNHLIKTTKNLSSAIGSSGFQNHFNATIPAESAENSGTSYDSTTTELTIGAQDGIGGGGRFYDGEIEELIIYKSDQSANRFKIESNINNYYGLYNDANEFSTSTWQNGGTGSNDSWDSLTNSSTDGFVASTDNGSGSTENAVCSLNFANVVPDNGRVFVSFNCEFGGTAVTAASQKLRVQLRDSSGNIANDVVQPADGGDGGTQFRICNQGFNRVAYTVNSSTASNIEFLLEVANGRTGSATVTDLKVSRIARDGFVETWYDQSGNGRNATQATAAQQPELVVNGGIAKNSGGLPSPRFSRVLDVGLELDFSGVNVDNTSVYVVNQQNRNFSNALVANMSGFRVRFGRHFDSSDGNIRKVELEIANSGDTQHLYGTTNLNTQPAYGLYLAYLKGGGTSKVGFNSVTATSTSLTLDGTYTWNQIFRGDSNSSNRNFNHMIPELIIYSGDKLVDTEIADNIKDYYNI